jgi:CheY-like chemotaxis protein
MLKAGNRAATLVRQLLAFSRRQVLEMRDVDLNEAVSDMLKMLRRLIGEHIALDFHAGHALGIVRADVGQMGQVLANLCVNARDAMPDGGTLTIETENVRIDEEYCQSHAWAKPGRFVLLSVTDTGCGMDSEILEKIFEPFFTTKGVGKGTGLGLSTVYGLVKQHEGMIHAYSEIGKGTAFKIYLPIVERLANGVGNKLEGDVAGGTETILLAEDDEMLRKLTRTILERAGYTVLTAGDGEEALEVFAQHADAIDLLLFDVMMPRLGGCAAYERIRGQRPGVRVLFASGYSMNAVHTNFVLEEGLALIQKPAQREDLLRAVRAALDA